MSEPTWDDHQHFESDWWGDCLNTFAEETKQLTYSFKMGLNTIGNNGKWPVWDLQHKSVLDIGGGPTSMLLKTINRGESRIVDPCDYPAWTYHRYGEADIECWQMPAEEYHDPKRFDEAWIYNVLQHVQDPAAILQMMRERADVIRVFEWIDMPPMIGHPHELKAELLDEWLDGTGQTEHLNENFCVGRAYFGVFKGLPQA